MFGEFDIKTVTFQTVDNPDWLHSGVSRTLGPPRTVARQPGSGTGNTRATNCLHNTPPTTRDWAPHPDNMTLHFGYKAQQILIGAGNCDFYFSAVFSDQIIFVLNFQCSK